MNFSMIHTEQKENIKVEEVQVDHQENDAGIVKKDRHTKHPDLNQKGQSEVWNAFLQIARFVNGDESETQQLMACSGSPENLIYSVKNKKWRSRRP